QRPGRCGHRWRLRQQCGFHHCGLHRRRNRSAERRTGPIGRHTVKMEGLETIPARETKLLSHSVVVADLFYLPPIEFFVAVAGKGEIRIEKHDNYQKQSYRNRTAIQLANQVKNLSIPIVGGNKKTPYTDVEMDDSQNWRKIHLRSIQSAYRSEEHTSELQ